MGARQAAIVRAGSAAGAVDVSCYEIGDSEGVLLGGEMTKSFLQRTMAQIEKRMKAVADERDKLDDLISDLESLKSDCEEAHNHLQDARDALSRLV